MSAKKTKFGKFLAAAIEEAQIGLQEGGLPIGSVLVHDGNILGRGHNKRIQNGSTILHGEMDAMENAGRLSASVYKRCTLYTTLSPCVMCSGTILLYGIPFIVIAENVNFMGEEDLLKSRGVKLEVLQDAKCIEMMKIFIEENAKLWQEDIGK
ncbi:MAG: nucleoside deaminase [Nitrospirae bacterium]|nr:nucleoside deaminase [Candidatus Manganitrophaceae bacterium]